MKESPFISPTLFNRNIFAKKSALALTFVILFNFAAPALSANSQSGQEEYGQATTTPALTPPITDNSFASIGPDSIIISTTTPDGLPVIIIIDPGLATSTATSTDGQLPPKPEVVEEVKKPNETATSTPADSYGSLMREINARKQGKSAVIPKSINSQPDALPALPLKDRLEKFIDSEKQRLSKLNVSEEKQKNYLVLLDGYLAGLSQPPTPFRASVPNAFSTNELSTNETSTIADIPAPSQPGTFSFVNNPVKINTLLDTSVKPSQIIGSDQNTAVPEAGSSEATNSASTQTASSTGFSGLKFPAELQTNATADSANVGVNGTTAATTPAQDLPVLADVQQDGGEIVLNSAIVNLAASLDNNPVKIYNYVRGSLEYEPYFGAKKGALGCLTEKLCNDTDSASLTIALLRAAGIPARYKKDLVVMSTDQLKNLLGVDETKTAYAALYWNKVPVYVLNNGTPPGDFDSYNFSGVTQLALEWTYAEAFYEYDDRGGNFPNVLGFNNASSTGQVQAALAPFPKKQWVPLDAIAKPYSRAKNEIVPDTVNFNTQNFWTNYLSSQSSQAPLQKYTGDLQAQSGKNIATSTYQSTRLPIGDEVQILPPALPYLLGVSPDFNTETWSQLPDSRRHEVTITLKKDSDKSIVLRQKFFGSEINNQPLDLFYKGATAQDQAIIDSYGGIPATPAALVDIVPYFSPASPQTASATPIKIGESLVMQFDGGKNGQILHTDQKFSVAGNQEGIYISLSKPLGDPLIDSDPGKILLTGNSALARNYLKRISDNFDSYKKALDVSANVSFSRAVVTQSRILNTVNGLPTTFDFKGLTLDASSDIVNYSNRGNYRAHDKDLHLLFGLDASYHEGQFFNDIAGLDGISTVKGLQFASAHPADYTVSTITLTNEAQIDSLQLSANTKQNMHADVQKGNTIITPNKLITDGQWNGILYISLAPDGTGTYAIGEQSQQNGGFTTNDFTTVTYGAQGNGNQFTQSVHTGPSEVTVYADVVNNMSRLCRVQNSLSQEIYNEPGYDLYKYGNPCYKETKAYGTRTHTFIITTNAVKFIGPDYNYWAYNPLARAVIDEDAHNFSPSAQLENDLNFNLLAGTFVKKGKYNGLQMEVFYQPSNNGNRGFGRVVYGDFYAKLHTSHYNPTNYYCVGGSSDCGSANWVLNIVGFPTDNQGNAAPSRYGSFGSYQHFIGGEMYMQRSLLNVFGQVVYIPIQISQIYQGTGSDLGFPIQDPVLDQANHKLTQVFEKDTIVYDAISHIASTLTAVKDVRRNQNKGNALIWLQKVKDGEITDVEAFAKITDFIAKGTLSNDDFVSDLAVVFVGTESMVKSQLPGWLGGDSAAFAKYRVLGFSDTGFKFIYNDSHYCMDEGHYNCISNQIFHSMAGFNLAYNYGYTASELGGFLHDITPSPLGFDGMSIQDMNLSYKMAEAGSKLRDGVLNKSDFGQWILNNVGDSNLLKEKQTDIIAEAPIKKKFRVFEFEQNQDISQRWGYSTDMRKYNCPNGNELFYQDYDYFWLNNEMRAPAKAVWNDSAKKIVFLFGSTLSQNNKESQICSNLIALTNSSGYNLSLEFNNPDFSSSLDPDKYLIDKLKVIKAYLSVGYHL